MIDIELVPEDMEEKDYPKYAESKGYLCIKLDKRNSKKIKQVLNNISYKVPTYEEGWKIKDIVDIHFEELFVKGSPDFIIYNEYSFHFGEFKSKSDELRPHQLMWFGEHQDWNLLIIVATYPGIKAHKQITSRELNWIYHAKHDLPSLLLPPLMNLSTSKC